MRNKFQMLHVNFIDLFSPVNRTCQSPDVFIHSGFGFNDDLQLLRYDIFGIQPSRGVKVSNLRGSKFWVTTSSAFNFLSILRLLSNNLNSVRTNSQMDIPI